MSFGEVLVIGRNENLYVYAVGEIDAPFTCREVCGIGIGLLDRAEVNDDFGACAKARICIRAAVGVALRAVGKTFAVVVEIVTAGYVGCGIGLTGRKNGFGACVQNCINERFCGGIDLRLRSIAVIVYDNCGIVGNAERLKIFGIIVLCETPDMFAIRLCS